MNITKGVIMFTDIKSSSTLWKKYPNEIYLAINIHDQIIQGIIQQNKGMVVKPLGDSFMAYFDTKESAIKSAMSIQIYLNENPILVGNEIMRIRIGLASGEMYYKYSNIQNCKMKDFFGNTVNTASRMESKVSEIGGFAIAFLDTKNQEMPKNVKKMLSKKFKIRKIVYKDKCRKIDSLVNSECKLIAQLKGIKPVKVYSMSYK